MFEEAIASRMVGQYPLSIATSLAIESAMGIHPEIPVESPPIKKFEELWVNIRTLFRNFLGALPKDAVKAMPPREIAQALLQEMEQIVSIVAPTRVVFYVSNYAGIEHKYRHGVIRRDTTDNQRIYTAIQIETIEELLKMQPQLELYGYELKLEPPRKARVLILTHYPYDLLSYKNFSELTLLESHTGAIKERAQWYTKYLHGKELPMIPFREDLIQVFGDAEHFRPGDPKLRKALIEVAQKYNWSAVSTYDKLLYGIEQLPNPFYVATMREIMSRAY
jgi:hypothetical protein